MPLAGEANNLNFQSIRTIWYPQKASPGDKEFNMIFHKKFFQHHFTIPHPQKSQSEVAYQYQALYLQRCSPEKFCAKQMVLKNVIRTNWGIQKSKVQNNIMCPLGDSSQYRQPILPKFGGFFGLCCTSPLKGHMI